MADLMRVSGLSSGIDWEGMIEKLMELERRPVLMLQKRQSILEIKKNAWMDVNSRLKNLSDKLAALKETTTFLGKTAQSTDASIVGASAGTDAQPASYSVVVQQLATATRWQSSGDVAFVDSAVSMDKAGFGTPITAGTFSIAVDNGTSTTSWSITVDPAVDSLDALLNRIQTETGGVVTATYDVATDKITLDAGAGNTLILGTSNDSSNFLQATGLLDNASAGAQSVTGWNAGRINTGLLLGELNLRSALSSTGSFTINGKTVSWDQQTDTLAGVIDKINRSGAGVTASYDSLNDRVTIRANSTGPLNINISDDTGGLLAALGIDYQNDQPVLGQKARFTLNGVGYESADNEVESLIPGLTLTLEKVSADPVTVMVKQDVEAAKKAIQAFVDQYNSVMDFIAGKLDYGEIGKSSDDGDLAGDPTLMRLQSALRTLVAAPVPNLSGPYKKLADIGVSTSGKDAKLEVDTTKLEEALKTDPIAVQELFFEAYQDNGLAAILDREIDAWIRSGDGFIEAKSDSLQSSMDELEEQIEAMERRLELREQSLYRQFITMEQTLSRLQSQGNWLSSQLAGLNANWLKAD